MNHVIRAYHIISLITSSTTDPWVLWYRALSTPHDMRNLIENPTNYGCSQIMQQNNEIQLLIGVMVLNATFKYNVLANHIQSSN
jgi:hypothetical protein